MSGPLDNVQSGLYDSSASNNEYTLCPGVCVLPLAEDPPTDPAELATYSPVIIARLHAPFRIRKMTFGSAKTNNPPVIPKPADAGKFVFVGGSIAFGTAMNATFWNSDWGVTGSYTFVENCVSRVEDGFVLNSQPATLASDDANITQFGSNVPQIGAVSQAGPLAVAGYNAGQALSLEQGSSGTQPGGGGGAIGGAFSGVWDYTVAAFFPGTLFNPDLINGGT